MIFHPMKRMVWVVAMLFGCFGRTLSGQCAVSDSGVLFQATFEPYTNGFVERAGGCGRLWLDGNNLSFRFATIGASTISLRGPANPGEIGPILYDIPVGTNTFNATNYCDAAAGIQVGPNPYPPPPPPSDPRIPVPPPPAYYYFFLITTGSIAILPEQAVEIAEGKWTATFTYMERQPHRIKTVIFGGPILILDSDADGIPDYLDQCPNSAPGSLINSHGCSIDDLCPCEGPWKNHGEFEHCVKETVKDFEKAGLITKQQRHEIEKAAKESDCGKREKPEKPPKPPKGDK